MAQGFSQMSSYACFSKGSCVPNYFKRLSFYVPLMTVIGEFTKTGTATSCTTPPNNSVREQNNETARAKYNLGFSAVVCKTIGTLSIDDDEVGGRRPEVVEAT